MDLLGAAMTGAEGLFEVEEAVSKNLSIKVRLQKYKVSLHFADYVKE